MSTKNVLAVDQVGAMDSRVEEASRAMNQYKGEEYAEASFKLLNDRVKFRLEKIGFTFSFLNSRK